MIGMRSLIVIVDMTYNDCLFMCANHGANLEITKMEELTSHK
jgi:hypothetical protein